MKRLLRTVLERLVDVLGSNLKDYQTGETIARAIVLSWGGKIHLLGLRGGDQVLPIFLPQEKMSFWRRSIGFTVHPRPDFPHEADAGTPR